jgi:TonB family protein
MTLLAIVVSMLVAQSAAPQAPTVRPNCYSPTDEATVAYCNASQLLRKGEGAPADRAAALKEAAGEFRRAANVARELPMRKLALVSLETVYDKEHLNLPAEQEGILREMFALDPSDLQPMFRVAKIQEDQQMFDAAEATLLGVRQMRPLDPEPYRELSQYFQRRASVLSGDPSGGADKADKGPDEPDDKGVYNVGGSIAPPDRTSGAAPELPAAAKAAGITSGAVVAEIVVDETGRVSDIKILRSVPQLDAAAVANIKTWMYQPATLKGHPVPVRLVVEVTFQ